MSDDITSANQEVLAMDKPASQVLEEASEVIEAGWCQGLFRSFDPEEEHDTYCAVGALAKVLGVQPDIMAWISDEPDSFGYVLGALGDTVRIAHVPTWNDKPGRTKEEVIDAMMTTAKRLRNEGK